MSRFYFLFFVFCFSFFSVAQKKINEFPQKLSYMPEAAHSLVLISDLEGLSGGAEFSIKKNKFEKLNEWLPFKFSIEGPEFKTGLLVNKLGRVRLYLGASHYFYFHPGVGFGNNISANYNIGTQDITFNSQTFLFYKFPSKLFLKREFLSLYAGARSHEGSITEDELSELLNKSFDYFDLEKIHVGLYYNPDIANNISYGLETNFSYITLNVYVTGL